MFLDGLGIGDHLEELRGRLLRAALAWVTLSSLAWFWRLEIYAFIAAPVGELVYFSPAGAFMAFLKVSLFAGLVGALPYWLWHVAAFLGPAMLDQNRRMLNLALLAVLALFYSGALLGWLLTGSAVRFLAEFSGPGLKAMISADAYFGFVLTFVMGCGLIFEMPVAAAMLAKLGLVESHDLRRRWKLAVIASMVLSALITPSPDAFTQLMLGFPIFSLYLVSIQVAAWVERRQKEPAAQQSTT